MVGAGEMGATEYIPSPWFAEDVKTQYWFVTNNDHTTGSWKNMIIPDWCNHNLQAQGNWFSAEQCAHELSDYLGGVTVYISKLGQGGTTLDQAVSDTPFNYTLFKDGCLDTMASIAASPISKTPVIPYVILYHGTNDGNKSVNGSTIANSFQDNLNWFYSSLKTDLSLPGLKIIVIRVSDNSAITFKTTIQSKLAAFIAEDPTNRLVIDATPFPMYQGAPANIHHTVKGYRMISTAVLNTIKDGFA